MSDEQISVSTDGIYATCGFCFAIVANKSAHDAWHESRGEGATDADAERA